VDADNVARLGRCGFITGRPRSAKLELEVPNRLVSEALSDRDSAVAANQASSVR
jgi:hypothetical protein